MSDSQNGPQEGLQHLEGSLNDAHRRATSSRSASSEEPVLLLLEDAIRHALEARAARVQFSPALRARILSQLPSRRRAPTRRFRLALALSAVLALLLTLSLVLALPLLRPVAPEVQAIRYTVLQTLAAPPALAQGGRLVAVDPTGQHLVFQAASEPGVMYTASLTNPAATQVLAMREAHNAVWSPDGSALVAIVTPPGASQPLLALIPYGQYMYPLGKSALAAAWTPTPGSEITYVTRADQRTQLWETTRSGQPTHLLATMNLELTVHDLAWSPDGRHLAMLAASGSLDQPGRAIYLMDRQRGSVETLVPPGAFSITSFGWSPDSRFLTYERLDAHGQLSLVVLDIQRGRQILSLPIAGQLAGWSWSPDSENLVYSVNGRLVLHSFGSPHLLLPATKARQLFPIWLRDGRLLVVQSDAQGQSQLVLIGRAH
jgi:hypothetical protein